MPSRPFAATPQAIHKLLAQGRGQGHGADYQPWLMVRDVASCGQVNRIRGHTTAGIVNLTPLWQTEAHEHSTAQLFTPSLPL